MSKKVLRAIILRYGSLATLKLAMWEIEENELLTIIKNLLR